MNPVEYTIETDRNPPCGQRAILPGFNAGDSHGKFDEPERRRQFLHPVSGKPARISSNSRYHDAPHPLIAYETVLAAPHGSAIGYDPPIAAGDPPLATIQP